MPLRGRAVSLHTRESSSTASLPNILLLEPQGTGRSRDEAISWHRRSLLWQCEGRGSLRPQGPTTWGPPHWSPRKPGCDGWVTWLCLGQDDSVYGLSLSRVLWHPLLYAELSADPVIKCSFFPLYYLCEGDFSVGEHFGFHCNFPIEKIIYNLFYLSVRTAKRILKTQNIPNIWGMEE